MAKEAKAKVLDQLDPMKMEPALASAEAPDPGAEKPPEAEKPPDAKCDFKSLWIDKGKLVSTTIYAYFERYSGQLAGIYIDALPADQLDVIGLREYALTGEFTLPSVEQLGAYRFRASRYVAEASSLLVRSDLARRLLLRHHLQNLSIPGEDGEPQKLDLPREEDRLSDAAEGLLNQLHPALVERLVGKFLRENFLAI